MTVSKALSALRAWCTAIVCGIATALSLPPWQQWWLAPIALTLLWTLAGDHPAKTRFALGLSAAFAHFAMSLWWMREFSIPGFIGVVTMQSAFTGVATMAVPAKPAPIHRRILTFVGAFTVLEALRMRVPFGGLPIGSLALGQVSGPLAPIASLGGALALVLTVTLIGSGLGALVGGFSDKQGKGLIAGPVALGLAAAAIFAGTLVWAEPSPAGATPLRVGLVQGGGPRGFTAIESDQADEVFQRHYEASKTLPLDLDLVVWPENTVDPDVPLAQSTEGQLLFQLASDLNTDIVVGVTESAGEGRFTNYAAVVNGEREIVSRYDKVQRVPFGEYVPLRSFVSRFADLSAVSSDAIPGTEPGLLTSSDGTKFGVVISYEVFFGARGISGIAEGGEVLLVPTNSASYETSQVPELTLAASQLQAVQTGRWVLQTSPTGYAAIVDSQGVVRTRTRLSDQTTIVTTVPRLTDSLPYVQFGDTLMIALAGTLLAGGRIVRRPTKREAAASAAAEPASADAAS